MEVPDIASLSIGTVDTPRGKVFRYENVVAHREQCTGTPVISLETSISAGDYNGKDKTLGLQIGFDMITVVETIPSRPGGDPGIALVHASNVIAYDERLPYHFYRDRQDETWDAVSNAIRAAAEREVCGHLKCLTDYGFDPRSVPVLIRSKVSPSVPTNQRFGERALCAMETLRERLVMLPYTRSYVDTTAALIRTMAEQGQFRVFDYHGVEFGKLTRIMSDASRVQPMQKLRLLDGDAASSAIVSAIHWIRMERPRM